MDYDTRQALARLAHLNYIGTCEAGDRHYSCVTRDWNVVRAMDAWSNLRLARAERTAFRREAGMDENGWAFNPCEVCERPVNEDEFCGFCSVDCHRLYVEVNHA